VEVNFDMITYAKGAAVLKQLVAWVGLAPFLAGLQQYFRDHAYDNSTFADLLHALETSSGRELEGWAAEWLQTAGVNTLAPEFELDDEGRYTSFAVRQSADPDWPTLRRHRIAIGLYEDVDGSLVRRDRVEVDVQGELTPIEGLVGRRQPDLLLLNDEDLAYAKIRLDERSLVTAVDELGRLDDSLARAVVWGAAWDMTRDAQMRATDFVHLVLRNIARETDPSGLSSLPRFASLAAHAYSAPGHREQLLAEWEAGLRRLVEESSPGSDHQLTFVRHYALSARSDDAVADLRGLLDGSWAPEGLALDQDLRWTLLTGLARAGQVDDVEIVAEQERDGTIVGQERAAGVRASRPTAEAKAQAWETVMQKETPNETSRSIVLAFMRHGQADVLAPYLEKYLDAAETMWDTLGTHKASVVLEHIFPRPLASVELLERVDGWLASSTAKAGVKRYVTEGRSDVARALAAQARDARD
ncbi:MAG: ERAP1-like C-terminal domain-containing protein, partial [Nocardioides sp.]